MVLSDRITHKAFLVVAAVLAFLAGVLSFRTEDVLPVYYFQNQDLPALGVALAALVLAAFYAPRVRLPQRAPARWTVVATAVILALALWAGTYWIMFDYPLTRDEHMVVFDMGVFGSGKLAEPLAPEWQEYSKALVPAFLLDVPNSALLVSSYMPGNAMMRTGFSMLADPALMNPVLAAIGLVALYDIAKRFFPENQTAVVVVLAGYMLSAQVLVNAMTVYAMTGHLALNLLWLALFLRGKWWQHALAMLVGMWTIGLHQVVFHPLFAGPVILTLLWKRQWWLFGAYAVTYAAALLFWLSYPSLVVSSFGIVPDAGTTGGVGNFFTERVLPLLTERDPGGITYMEFNLVRFATWTPLFVVPFVAMAWADIRGNRGMALPLFGGIFLTLLAMMVLLPYQGHGWGYRYLHGLIGNFALLAGYGYARWSDSSKANVDGAFALLAGVTAVLLVPFLLWSAHSFTTPYVDLTRLIDRQTTDFVMVDTHPPSSAVDQVRNLASLENYPILLSSRAMTPEQVMAVCERGTVTLITRADFHRAGFATKLPVESEDFEWLVSGLEGRDCLKPAV